MSGTGQTQWETARGGKRRRGYPGWVHQLPITRAIVSDFGGFIWRADVGALVTAAPDVDTWAEYTDVATWGSVAQSSAAAKPHLDTTDPDGPLLDFNAATTQRLLTDKVSATRPITPGALSVFDWMIADTGGRVILIFKQKRAQGGTLFNTLYGNVDGLVCNQAAGLVAFGMYRGSVFTWQIITASLLTLDQLAMVDCHFSKPNGASVQIDDNTPATTTYSGAGVPASVGDFYISGDQALAAVIGVSADISAEDGEALRWELSRAFPIAGTYPISVGNPRLIL